MNLSKLQKLSIQYKLSKLAELNYWYHFTKSNRLDSILKNGLKPGSEQSFTIGNWADSIYDISPIYLSKTPIDKYKEDDGVLLKIDIKGLILVTDIGTLIDYGAYLESDHLWFKETPKELEDFDFEDGVFHYSDLLDPKSSITKAMIEFTETAACLSEIPPNQIHI